MNDRGESDLFWPMTILASVAVGFFVYTLMSNLSTEDKQTIGDMLSDPGVTDMFYRAGLILVTGLAAMFLFKGIIWAVRLWATRPTKD